MTALRKERPALVDEHLLTVVCDQNEALATRIAMSHDQAMFERSTVESKKAGVAKSHPALRVLRPETTEPKTQERREGSSRRLSVSRSTTRGVTDVELVDAVKLNERQIAIWNEILDGDDRLDHPQLRPEFVLAVARSGRLVEVAVLKSSSETVGFFPFVRTSPKTGEAIGGPAADFEALICPESVRCDLSMLLRKCGLSVWKFAHLTTKQSVFEPYQAYTDEAPYLDLSRGYSEYLSSLKARSRSSLSAIERKGRKLEREVGAISFEYRVEDPKQAIFWLSDWKRQQLNRLGFDDMFAHAWIQKLIRNCAQSRSEDFQPTISLMRAGERPVAVHFGIRTRKVLLSWIPAYCPEFHEYSPGAQLFLRIAEAAAKEGVARLDLGRGENQLKMSLASDSYSLAIGTVAAHRPVAIVRNAALNFKRKLRAQPWIYRLWQGLRIRARKA